MKFAFFKHLAFTSQVQAAFGWWEKDLSESPQTKKNIVTGASIAFDFLLNLFINSKFDFNQALYSLGGAVVADFFTEGMQKILNRPHDDQKPLIRTICAGLLTGVFSFQNVFTITVNNDYSALAQDRIEEKFLNKSTESEIDPLLLTLLVTSAFIYLARTMGTFNQEAAPQRQPIQFAHQ